MRLLLALLLTAATCAAQSYTQRGFLETDGTFYPQEGSNDSSHAVGASLLRYEGFYQRFNALQIAGALDFRTDTHRQVERNLTLSWWDREIQRPSGEVRRLSATYHGGPVAIEVGKQFIRWGKTDLVTPTDRFAPRDFLTVVDNDFLAVTAGRINVEEGRNTFEAVWQPRLTPSRIPLPKQRWAPESSSVDLARVTSFPGGPAMGVRWNHSGPIEYELSAYRGFNNLPSFVLTVPEAILAVNPTLKQFYPRMFMVGGDVAIPTGLLTIKSEAAYFNSRNDPADDYVQYVVQLERQAGEWFFVGGYAGEAVTQRRTGTFAGPTNFVLATDFAPDRGLSKTFLGRAGYTIDTNRNVALEAAARDNGQGMWIRGEYSQAFGQHWRATLDLTLIRGDMGDFLGQYRDNSHALVSVRYSF